MGQLPAVGTFSQGDGASVEGFEFSWFSIGVVFVGEAGDALFYQIGIYGILIGLIFDIVAVFVFRNPRFDYGPVDFFGSVVAEIVCNGGGCQLIQGISFGN